MLNLIVAPKEINANAEKLTKRIAGFLKQENVEYSVFFCEKLENVASFAQELVQEGETEFVLVGDDLIINCFINSIKDLSKIKLGIVPTGGNDDFASFLGLPTNPIQAIKNILEKNIVPVDYLILNDTKVINNITLGASAQGLETYNEYKVKNSITHAYATRQNAAKFEGIELTFNSRGKTPTTEIIFEMSISNAGKSRGKNVSPLANVSDGLFNFNYVTLASKKEKSKYLSLFNKGNQIYDEQTKQYWLNNLKIYSPNQKIKAIVDGKINTYDEMSITLIENGLKLYKK